MSLFGKRITLKIRILVSNAVDHLPDALNLKILDVSHQYTQMTRVVKMVTVVVDSYTKCVLQVAHVNTVMDHTM